MLKKATSLAVLALFAACTKQAPDNLSLTSGNIVSARQFSSDAEAVMVRLKTPALIETATITGKTVKIDEAQKERLLAEQEEFIKSVKKISSDIQVLYRTKIILNGVTVVVPEGAVDAVKKLPMVQSVNSRTLFSKPDAMKAFSLGDEEEKEEEEEKELVAEIAEKNSVSFIGGLEAIEKYGLTGKGKKIGIIDTGIDYTHSMFLGSGSKDQFEFIDRNGETPVFPNDKVVGGIDLVGDLYSPNSPYKEHRIPKPDSNPIDVEGHGTHVAGTVAGIGDNSLSYNGVAPDADLYAIKVFGKDSTSDDVVIAALEYAVDPNGDLDLSDKLDIVNLSLGGGYGKPAIDYSEAVKNTVRAGVSVVAAAGNSGDNPYIVGAPGTAAEALSVAAGIDHMEHNYNFTAGVVKVGEDEKTLLAPFATFTKKLKLGEEITGSLVYVGTANEELSADLAAKVKGKIALVDRGVKPFAEKTGNVQKAGAIGIVIVNNVPGDPAVMPGELEKDKRIPAVMITKLEGDKVKDALQKGAEASFVFSTKVKIPRAELIDTVTSFSSRGPRSEDGLIKPEIVAPGNQIISADVGKGSQTAALNGTSMASPHMAGVMALIQQRFPNLSALDHKHLLMTHAKIINDAKGVRYPVTAQGAGRVDIMRTMEAKVLADRGGFSLGKVNLIQGNSKREKLKLTNLTDKDITFTLKPHFSNGLSIRTSGTHVLKANGELNLDIEFFLANIEQSRSNYEGYLMLMGSNGKALIHFPVLAVVLDDSAIRPESVGASGKDLTLTLKNDSPMKGKAYPFIHLGTDSSRKADPGAKSHILSRACDLKSAGYRVINRASKVKETVDGKEVEKTVHTPILQVGVKLYEPVSDWQSCQISVQIDNDGDENMDQEWVGAKSSNLPGLALPQDFNVSMVIDANIAREMRIIHEVAKRESKGENKNELDFSNALVTIAPYEPFHNSSVNIIEVELEHIAKTKFGKLNFRIGTLHEEYGAIQTDDYLMGENKWFSINPIAQDWPEVIEVDGKGSKTVVVPMASEDDKFILFSDTNSDGTNKTEDLQEMFFGTF